MRALPLGALTTVSFAALTLGLAAPAAAQQAGGQVTPSEAQQCANLPTEQERQQCVAAQARPEGTAEEAGEAATLSPGEAAEQRAESDEIVVTGSRIRRTVFNSPDPLTIIDPELERKGGENDTAEILQTSSVAAGSVQLTSLITAGGFVTNGGVGAQTISLRGLGAERTLVLLNGRRAGPAGTRGSIAGFDLNVVPSSTIQSVEVLKTGASSIYGSDAIAGVVNLITRKATDGVEMRGFASAPIEGGAENYNVSVAYGREFSRGHLIGGVDYFRRNDLSRGDRDYLLCPEEYIFTPAGARADIIDPRTGRPRCNAFFSNALNISTQALPGGITFGTIQFNGPGDRLNEFVTPAPNTATFGLPAGFFPVSQACPATATEAQFLQCRNSIGVLDPNDPLVNNTDVFPELDRYTVFLDGSYEITDNIELVGEFLYNRRKTATDGVRQLFFTQFSGQTLGTTSTTRPAAQCTPARILTNPNCDPTSAGDPLNAGFLGNFLLTPIVPVATFVGTKVDYLRGVVGVKADLGGFLDGWNFDSYLQYSRSDGDYTNSRILNDAVQLQELRSRTCQPGQVTRLGRVPCLDIDFTDPRVLRGEFTPAEAAFLFDEETGNTLYTQLTAEASVSGTVFRLPAGPVGVAFGVQWRRDEIDDTPGDITLARNPDFNPTLSPTSPLCQGPLQPCTPLVSNVFGQSVSGRTAGFSRSEEAFGEIEIPLIHNTPFIENLTLSAAARVVNGYAERDVDGVSDTDKGNWTYKLGANWQVNDWLRFRASYGTSFRSPALFEQFLSDQTGFLGQAAIDPCIRYGQGPGGALINPADYNRFQQRCASVGLAPDYSGAGTSSAVVATGGGIGVLEPETSTAKTFSVVLTPDVGFWEGMRFSVAVDYFDIDVKGQVTTLGAFNIIDTCFDSETFPNDPTCSLFVRDQTPGSARFGEILSVRNPFININRQRNRGIDVTARVTQDLGRYGRLSVLGQMTWQIEDLFVLFAGSTADSEGEVGEPAFVGDFRATWAKGPWSLFYGLNVTGAVSNEQDLRNARAGALCLNSPVRGGLVCPIYKFDEQFLHSASVTREIGDRFSMTLGLNNIFNTKPPRASGAFGPVGVTGQTPTFGTQYDLIGRRAFVSVRAKL